MFQDIRIGSLRVRLMQYAGIVVVMALFPSQVLITQQPVMPTALTRGSVSQNLSRNQIFLLEVAQEVPALINECVSHEWHIARPQKDEARRLTWEHWGYYGDPTAITLDSVRGWWTARPVAYRAWAVCEGNFLRRLFTGLRPAIDSVQLRPAIEQVLVALTDTSAVTEARYVAVRIRSDSSAAKIVTAAAAIGDPHRYDGAIATYLPQQTYSYRELRGETFALLGRLYLTQGRFREARDAGTEAKRLTRWIDPMLLTEIGLRQGDTLAAVHDLAFCRVAVWQCTNTPSRDSLIQRQLFALYRTVNRGVLTGLDTVLKNVLHDATLQFPLPITPWHSDVEAHRATLIQYYTWTLCGNCRRHDLSVDAIGQRFGDRVIVLSYHYYPPLTFVGWPDQSTDMEKNVRQLLQVGTANTTNRNVPRVGLCDWWMDGSCLSQTVNTDFEQIGALSLYDQAVPFLEHRLNNPSEVRVAIHSVLKNDRIATAVTVTGLPTDTLHARHPLKLYTVLVEDSLLIPGFNSPVQNHLVRAIAGDSASGFGALLPVGDTTHTVHGDFDLAALEHAFRRKTGQRKATLVQYTNQYMSREYEPTEWNDRVFHLDRTQLSIVAYVQDQVTGEVLQAAQRKLSVASGI